MDHINRMTFRHAEKPATVDRAKGMTSACLQALKPLLTDALRDSVCDGVNVGTLIDPLLTAFDTINSRSGEDRERELRAEHPPLNAYERELGIRPARLGKRKAIDGVRAYAWDINLEEALEREAYYDPHFVTELIMSDLYWTKRAKELRGTDRRDPARTFEDMCDGEVWQAHKLMGDPDYNGPPRVCLSGYCDDVDVPNGLGPAAGHHKLYIQTVTVLNRPARSRRTMRAQFLSTVALSSDVKIFGAHKIMSGSGTAEFSLGATCRRLWQGGHLRLPIEYSLAGESTPSLSQ
jgi:hypothetical protein